PRAGTGLRVAPRHETLPTRVPLRRGPDAWTTALRHAARASRTVGALADDRHRRLARAADAHRVRDVPEVFRVTQHPHGDLRPRGPDLLAGGAPRKRASHQRGLPAGAHDRAPGERRRLTPARPRRPRGTRPERPPAPPPAPRT